MQRRTFITLLGGAAAWPLTAHTQQPPNVHRIAIVRTSGSVADMSEAGDQPAFAALFKELRRLGYVEGQNLIVERYSGEGRQERYTELVREVVRTKPQLIFAISSPLVRIATSSARSADVMRNASAIVAARVAGGGDAFVCAAAP